MVIPYQESTDLICFLYLGITNRLDYFDYLGVEILWLSPIYRSPMIDSGYDVADFTSIDPLFGNMDDFRELMAASQKQGSLVTFSGNHS